MPANNTFQGPPLEDILPVSKKNHAWVVVALLAFLLGMLCQSPLVGMYGCRACRAVCGNFTM